MTAQVLSRAHLCNSRAETASEVLGLRRRTRRCAEARREGDSLTLRGTWRRLITHNECVSRVLWLIVALFIVYGTTIPFEFSADRAAVSDKVAALSWNPLVRADGTRVSIPDSVQNVMLFLPFGVLGAFACHRRFTSGLVRVAAVTLAAAMLSGFVETLQLFTLDRVASFSDVMTDTFGGFVGALAVVRGRGAVLTLLREHGAAGWVGSPWSYPALVAVLVLVVAAWQPFDLTLDVGSVALKVRALLRDPWQAGPLTDEGNAVVLYGLGTVALAAWLEDTGVARASAKATAAGVALALGLELSQVFVSSRMPSGWDATVRIVGVVIGVSLWPALRRGGRISPWLALVAAATVVSAGVAMLSPFTLAASRQPFTWVPFLSYYESNWFPTVSHVIEVMLLYFPLGFCLGMVSRRTSGIVLALLAALAIATGIEYLQSWVVGRYADVTDIACGGFGGALGAWFSVCGAPLFERTRLSARVRT